MVSLTPSARQAARQDAVAALLADLCPPTRVRSAEPLGFDRDLWRAVVSAAGPDDDDLVSDALVASALGRHLAPVPWAEHAAATRLLRRLGEPPPTGIATLVIAEPAGHLVPAGAVADQLVALVDGQLLLAASPPPMRGPRNLADLPLADRSFTNDVTVLARGRDALHAYARARSEWQVLTAAALVGLAERALELTVAYVQVRHQFGVPIGSFQAVQHQLADRATALEGARLLTLHAAWRGEPASASAGFLCATETARAVTASAMQYHGGLGFTLQGDIQLFHRRSRGWPLVAGDPQDEWVRLGNLLYDGGASDIPDPSTALAAEGIDFSAPQHTEGFREEVRAFLGEHVTPEVIARVHETGTVHDWDFHRGLAARGWIGASWPVEDGGQGRDPWEMRVFAQECALADAPTDGLSIATMIGNTIRVVGTQAQKNRVLGGVLSGDVLLCMGYSEPEAGSDVAASQTTAVRDGDDWLINGEKVFTSMAHEAHFVFLLTRTNRDVPKHRGLTMFLVPMETPGITVEPLWTLGAPGRTNRTFYNDVRVADSCRIGEIDGGWAVMNVALSFERGGMFAPLRALRHAESWARATGRIDEPVVRARLARVHVANEVSGLLSLKSTWLHAAGALPGVEGSMAKLYAATAFQTSTADLLDLVGADALLHESEPAAPVGGTLEYQWRKSPVVSIYGGTNEIMRMIIAERHLGLPRTR